MVPVAAVRGGVVAAACLTIDLPPSLLPSQREREVYSSVFSNGSGKTAGAGAGAGAGAAGKRPADRISLYDDKPDVSVSQSLLNTAVSMAWQACTLPARLCWMTCTCCCRRRGDLTKKAQ